MVEADTSPINLSTLHPQMHFCSNCGNAGQALASITFILITLALRLNSPYNNTLKGHANEICCAHLKQAGLKRHLTSQPILA